MDLTSSEIEILKAIEKSGNDRGDYTSFRRMIGAIADPTLTIDDAEIHEALDKLKEKSFIEIERGRAVKLTESGIVALRAL
ncbi:MULTISPECIES: hypothetical protein [Filomicrobium]|uniref:hypothetical protein n=1 Tax=Filomicrobium TaxID=119044 RepID=UPI000B7CBCCE|nr:MULTISPECIES: hypothetical protein [Filomicrobium]MCV0371446.1 DUF505 domain-containing protein [Filomicrobium sp.]